MTNQEAIEMLTAKAECIRREASGIDVDCNLRNCDECELCYAQGTTAEQREAIGVAISALQEQDSRMICNTCKHDPPSKKWPCEDCDMRESADRWEPKEAKDKDDGDLQQTCNNLATDTISRRKAIALADNLTKRYLSNNEWITYTLIAHNEAIWEYQTALSMLPPAQPEPSIPISWIEKQIDWLKSMDNEFSNLTAMNISALVKKWRKENGKDKQSG